MFDEQPDGDMHGECAAEIHHLEAQRDKLLVALHEIGQYVDQTYSDLIGHLGAEWLAARMADHIMPIVRKATGAQSTPQPTDGPAVAP